MTDEAHSTEDPQTSVMGKTPPCKRGVVKASSVPNVTSRRQTQRWAVGSRLNFPTASNLSARTRPASDRAPVRRRCVSRAASSPKNRTEMQHEERWWWLSDAELHSWADSVITACRMPHLIASVLKINSRPWQGSFEIADEACTWFPLGYDTLRLSPCMREKRRLPTMRSQRTRSMHWGEQHAAKTRREDRKVRFEGGPRGAGKSRPRSDLHRGSFLSK